MEKALHLVTGGSGYFGSLLVRKLREQGQPVRIFDLVDATDRPADVEFVQGDILDLAAVRRACAGAEVVYHNVAQIALAKSEALLRAVNVDGTERLLEAARLEGVKKTIYTSTSAVYGVPPSNPVTEAMQPRPQESYGQAKRDGELACLRAAERGQDVSILRPTPILGHGRLGIFQVLFEWIRQGSNLPVMGRGDNLFQFIHAGDFAEANILAGRRRGPAVYNIGAERYSTMRGMLEELCARVGSPSQVRSVPMWPAAMGMRVAWTLGLSPLSPFHALMYGRPFYFDISKARAELNWTPRYSNVEMLVEGYQWYLTNRDTVLHTPGASAHRSALKQGLLALLPRIL
jgi:nucleoside-diphosphate-sugar epimerase